MSNFWFALLGVAGLSAMGLAAPAEAADTPPLISVSDPVPRHGEITYLELLQQAIPDLVADGVGGTAHGHHTRPVRELAGGQDGDQPPDPVEVTYVEAQRIKAAGKDRILVLASLGQAQDSVASFSVLALFDDGPHPKLLDMVDVGMYRDTSFSEQAKLSLGPGENAVVTYSEHSNSSQTYGIWLVAYVRHDKLALAAQVFGLSDRECGWQRMETPTFTGRPVRGRALGNIDIVVREQSTRDRDAQCDSPPSAPYLRTWRATYRWDSAKEDFVTDSTALDRLAKRNEARF